MPVNTVSHQQLDKMREGGSSMKGKKTFRTAFMIAVAAAMAVLLLLEGSMPFAQPVAVEAKTVRTSITAAEVEGIKNKTWTGKRIKQREIDVYVSGIHLLEGRDYSVSYKHNKNVGTAKIIIKGKENYKGTITKTFFIFPQTPKIISGKRSGSKLAVKWKKINHQVSGYQVALNAHKRGPGANLRYAEIRSAGGRNTTSKTFSIGATYKWYRVWIRSYKKVGDKIYYSGWSDKITCFKDGTFERDDY